MESKHATNKFLIRREDDRIVVYHYGFRVGGARMKDGECIGIVGRVTTMSDVVGMNTFYDELGIRMKVSRSSKAQSGLKVVRWRGRRCIKKSPQIISKKPRGISKNVLSRNATACSSTSFAEAGTNGRWSDA